MPLCAQLSHEPAITASSNRISNPRVFPFTGEYATALASLRSVAQTFSQLQEDRHFAGYNLTKDLDPVEALTQVTSAERIFTIWRTIRAEQIAQAYLVSLLVKHV